MNYKFNENIDDRTKAFMKSIVAQVEGLETVDMGALKMLEFNYDTFVKQSDLLLEEDMVIMNVQGNLVTNPRVKIVRDAQTQCLAILKEFGLTLKSRSTVKAVAKDSEDNPLEAFMKQKTTKKKETR